MSDETKPKEAPKQKAPKKEKAKEGTGIKTAPKKHKKMIYRGRQQFADEIPKEKLPK